MNAKKLTVIANTVLRAPSFMLFNISNPFNTSPKSESVSKIENNWNELYHIFYDIALYHFLITLSTKKRPFGDV